MESYLGDLYEVHDVSNGDYAKLYLFIVNRVEG